MADRVTPPAWLPPAIVLTLVAVVVLGWNVSTWADDAHEQSAVLELERDVATDQRNGAADQALDLAAVIEQACKSGTIPPAYVGACLKADEVKATPIPPVDGRPGRPGLDGTPGAPGIDGERGLPGLNGAPGLPGFNGRDGADGPAGEPGSPGTPGAPGEDGAPGAVGPSGPQGERGPAGPIGPQGEQGPQGERGPPGCDAGTARDETGACAPTDQTGI